MAALLYKDFVAIKGKLMILLMSAVTIAYTAIRIIFAGNKVSDSWIDVNSFGNTICIIDTFFFSVFVVLLMVIALGINNFEAKIVEGDRKNKVLNYYNSMPFEKNTYFASKYIFLGIAMYVGISLSYVFLTISMAFCHKSAMMDIFETVGALIVPIFSFILFNISIEMPMYILWGKEKAMMVKDIFILIIAYVIVGYLCFGDLAFIDNLNPFLISEWMEKHQFEIVLINIFSPVIMIGLYYLSYRITCRLGNNEVMTND